MNDKTLTKHYDKLTEHERAILVVNAFGRDDKGECIRLIDAAPRVMLTAPEGGLMFHRLVFAIEWHALRQAEDAATLFLTMHLAATEPDKYPDADDVARVIMYNILTRADGWRIFCGELGLDPVGAMRIAAADTTLSEMAERLARAVPLDPDALRDKLRETFQNDTIELKTAEQVAAEYREFLSVAVSHYR